MATESTMKLEPAKGSESAAATSSTAGPKCTVCRDRRTSVAAERCGHLMLCDTCALTQTSQRSCPACEQLQQPQPQAQAQSQSPSHSQTQGHVQAQSQTQAQSSESQKTDALSLDPKGGSPASPNSHTSPQQHASDTHSAIFTECPLPVLPANSSFSFPPGAKAFRAHGSEEHTYTDAIDHTLQHGAVEAFRVYGEVEFAGTHKAYERARIGRVSMVLRKKSTRSAQKDASVSVEVSLILVPVDAAGEVLADETHIKRSSACSSTTPSAELSAEQRLAVARAAGDWVKRKHVLKPMQREARTREFEELIDAGASPPGTAPYNLRSQQNTSSMAQLAPTIKREVESAVAPMWSLLNSLAANMAAHGPADHPPAAPPQAAPLPMPEPAPASSPASAPSLMPAHIAAPPPPSPPAAAFVPSPLMSPFAAAVLLKSQLNTFSDDVLAAVALASTDVQQQVLAKVQARGVLAPVAAPHQAQPAPAPAATPQAPAPASAARPHRSSSKPRGSRKKQRVKPEE